MCWKVYPFFTNLFLGLCQIPVVHIYLTISGLLLGAIVCLSAFLLLPHWLDYCSSLAFQKLNYIIKIVHVHNRLGTREVLDLILSWIFNLYSYFLFPIGFFLIVCKCSYFRIAVSYLPESSVCFVLFSLEVFFSLHCLRLPFLPPSCFFLCASC